MVKLLSKVALLYGNAAVLEHCRMEIFPHLAGEAVRGDLGAAFQTAYLRRDAYHSDHLRVARHQPAVTWVGHEQNIL